MKVYAVVLASAFPMLGCLSELDVENSQQKRSSQHLLSELMRNSPELRAVRIGTLPTYHELCGAQVPKISKKHCVHIAVVSGNEDALRLHDLVVNAVLSLPKKSGDTALKDLFVVISTMRPLKGAVCDDAITPSSLARCYEMMKIQAFNLEK